MSNKSMLNICTALSAVPPLRCGAASIAARLSSKYFFIFNFSGYGKRLQIRRWYAAQAKQPSVPTTRVEVARKSMIATASVVGTAALPKLCCIPTAVATIMQRHDRKLYTHMPTRAKKIT